MHPDELLIGYSRSQHAPNFLEFMPFKIAELHDGQATFSRTNGFANRTESFIRRAVVLCTQE